MLQNREKYMEAMEDTWALALECREQGTTAAINNPA